MEAIKGSEVFEANVSGDAGMIQSVDHWISSNTVYVDHLPPDVTVVDLLSLFSRYGKVTRAKILCPDGVPPYGLLQFASATELRRFIESHSGFLMNGYQMRLSPFQDLEMPTELILDCMEDDDVPKRMLHRLADMTVEWLEPNGRSFKRTRPAMEGTNNHVSIVPVTWS